jgi:hypothetical protein
MMDFPDVAGFHDDAYLAAIAFADEVVVYGGGGQQGRDRRMVGIDSPVGEDEDFEAVFDGVYGIPAEAVEACLQGAGFAIGAEIGLEGLGLEDAGVDAADLFQLVVAEHGMFEGYAVAGQGIFFQQVGVAADEAGEGHDQSFPDGIDGRVGDLGEELFEIAAEVLGLVAEHGQGNVGAHGAERFFAVEGHRCDEVVEVFGGIAEGFLVFEDLVVFEVGEELPGVRAALRGGSCIY